MNALDRIIQGITLGILLGWMIVGVPIAKADVRSACQNDFMSNCSHTEPFSAKCRSCMRSVGRRGGLSQGCIAALKAAGEVTAADKAAYHGKR